MNRREFLRSVGSAAALSGPFGALLDAAACEREPSSEALDGVSSGGRYDRAYREAVRRAQRGGPPREVRLIAEEDEIEIGPGRTARTWLFNGEYPGPALRLREGERLRVTLENRLSEETTIHWHGIPVPNAMDGVPEVTQDPVAPGETFVYDFIARPAGTYIYHSHAGLQLDRGLLGSLVVEEAKPSQPFDREYVLVFDDALAGPPRPASDRGEGMMDGRGMMEGMRERMMRDRGRTAMPETDPARPDYAALLVNGRFPADPPELEVRRGDRVRLRLLNVCAHTTLRVALAGHRMTVTHADGRPVQAVEVDALEFGSGERYDVLVKADSPGIWTLAAASREGGPSPARAVVRYLGSAATRPANGTMPAGLAGGRVLRLEDLVAIEETEATPPVTGAPDRVFDLTLSGGMMMQRGWTIDGQRYPDAPPLEIEAGQLVEVRMTNRSMTDHPMHLHGHFFSAGRAIKDTVTVPAHMGRRTFAFLADNPGDWLFHCHKLYHLEAGMARVVRYRS